MNELISVILPVYNGEEYLDEAIQSILNQTYTNFEFIIINDGSTDKSLEIIKKYKEKDQRIVVISRENKGLIATLNEGIQKAKGKYIARMDQDDISLAKRFEEQIKFLEKNHEIGACGTWVEVFGENIKTKKWKLSCSNKRLKAELLFSSCFAHPSVMIKKNILIENNIFYDKNFLHVEDFHLWSILSKKTNFTNINKILFRYRIIDTSITRIADKDVVQRYQVISKIFDSYLKVLNIKNTEQENRLHFNLSVNTRIKDSNLSFTELKTYFNKLNMANNETKIFDTLQLNKVLGKKWFWNLYYTKKIDGLFSKYFFFGIWSIFSK